MNQFAEAQALDDLINNLGTQFVLFKRQAQGYDESGVGILNDTMSKLL